MKKNFYLLLIIFISNLPVNAQQWPVSLAGRWTFDNASNLLLASTGNNLLLTGTHTAVNGAAPGDGAASIGIGSYYTCNHGIAANGGGSLVNEYSLLFDVMIENPKVFHSLFQTNMGNSNDGDGFLNTHSQIGITATGYSGFSVKPKQWYRIVLTVDLGSSLRYYVDGHKVLEGNSQPIDGTYSLDPALLFFADNNSEDNVINVSQLAIFNTCLSAQDVYDLGGFHSSNIQPYLQCPDTNSVFISWYSLYSSGTSVQFGTSSALGQQTTGTYQDVSSVRWHTANLSGLTPGTKYYYRCISGNDTSNIFHFNTVPSAGTSGRHIRFLKFGDNQDDANKSTMISDTVCYLMQQLYGPHWLDSLTFVMNSGDITQDGTTIGRYMNEFFNPYSKLSPYLPVMVSIGNHESESNNYYNFMKYENLTGFNEKYYTFNINNCQFISLNTNGLYNNVTQTNWLQSQLNQSANNPDIDFVFVFHHHPAHSEIWPDGNTSYVLNSINPLLSTFPKVVMTTFGHAHNYERGCILGTHSGNWDIRTVLSGGAGGPLDRWGMYSNQQNYSEVQKSLDCFHFLLVDIDIDNQKIETYMYSMGNNDRPRNIELMDQWHRYLNQDAPDKPIALWPDSVASATPVLCAGPFSGIDSLMSSQFQLIPVSGSFSSPLIDIIRDCDDYYGDTGSPVFTPNNLNAGIDLKRLAIDPGILTAGQSYMWRMRYRDQNVRWSEWSDTLMFTVVSNPQNQTDFAADVLSGAAPLTVRFTDLSVYNPFSWEWDLDGDGITDDNVRDPVFTYTAAGSYTVSLTTQVGAQILGITKQSYINVLPSGLNDYSGKEYISVFPNPSDAESYIVFNTDDELINIQISDINGKLVKTIKAKKDNDQAYTFIWDGCNESGKKVGSGIYILKASSANFHSTCKIIRL